MSDTPSPRLRLIRSLLASDRIWIFASSVFSRIGFFFSNLILARYGGPAVFGTYSAILGTATSVVSPAQWALSTSATLETRSAPDDGARRAVIAAHVQWALRLAIVASAAFLILQFGTHLLDTGGSHDVLATAAGLVTVLGMLVATVLQGAMYGMGVFKPVASRLIAVALISAAVAVPAVFELHLVGALAALIFQYALLPAALVHLAKPSARDRARVAEALAAARRQLIRSVPNILAILTSSAASWLTTIYLVERSQGAAGVGIFAVGLSWLTIQMLGVTAWGGLTMRILGEAHATSPQAFRSAIRRVLVKDMSFTLGIGGIIFLCAVPLARLYGMGNTCLPTILRVDVFTGVVMAATQVYERSMFCVGEQASWMRARVFGGLFMLGLARWLLPRGLEYGAIAMFFGFLATALMCEVNLWRTRRR